MHSPPARAWRSGGGEYSQLRQDGAGGKTRSFWRPKGAISLAWNPSSPWETNLKLQRKVGQLDFSDFLVSVDLDTNNSNGGNPELVPPQSWLLQFELIRSLGPLGKIRLNLEGEDIQDLVEQIPLTPTPKRRATSVTPGE
jgi:outer membrane receptor for ferrienterochelin and colicins